MQKSVFDNAIHCSDVLMVSAGSGLMAHKSLTRSPSSHIRAQDCSGN